MMQGGVLYWSAFADALNPYLASWVIQRAHNLSGIANQAMDDDQAHKQPSCPCAHVMFVI